MAARGRGRGLILGKSSKPVECVGQTKSDISNKLKMKTQITESNDLSMHEKISPPDKQPINSSVVSSENNSDADIALNDWKSYFSSLSIEPSSEELIDIRRNASIAMQTDEHCQKMALHIYSRVQDKKEMAKVAALVCETLCSYERMGKQFRAEILNIIQSDYNNKETLRLETKDKFLAMLSMLVHVFNIVHVAGMPLMPLANAILACCHLILDGDHVDEDECEVFAQLMIVVGGELQRVMDRDMQVLMELVRTKIIHQCTGPRVRCHLLELLEHFLCRWQPAPSDVTKFYIDTGIELVTQRM